MAFSYPLWLNTLGHFHKSLRIKWAQSEECSWVQFYLGWESLCFWITALCSTRKQTAEWQFKDKVFWWLPQSKSWGIRAAGAATPTLLDTVLRMPDKCLLGLGDIQRLALLGSRFWVLGSLPSFTSSSWFYVHKRQTIRLDMIIETLLGRHEAHCRQTVQRPCSSGQVLQGVKRDTDATSFPSNSSLHVLLECRRRGHIQD